MDIQQALLSKIIHNEDIVHVVNARITPEFFSDERYRRIFTYLVEHWQKFGTAPDLAVVKQAFPSYSWPVERQSTDYFIDLLRQRRTRSILTSALQTAATELATADNPAAIDAMETVLREALWQVRLETAPTLDMDLSTERSTEFEDLLDDRMENPGFLRGITTGFDGINKVTGGFQPEQFVVLIGLPKSLKSSTLLYMAMECNAAAKIPLFIGFEMSNTEQMDRLVSLSANVNLTKIMTGGMNAREYKTVRTAIRKFRWMKPFIMSVDLDSAMTVDGIQAKMMEYIPDVVFIDGAYLMQSTTPKVEQGSPQALTDIARSLKRLAQNMRTPIVVTTQASMTRSRGGVLNAFSAMYTQAWQQSADVLLGVERVEDDSSGSSSEVMIKVRVLNSRSGPRNDTFVVWDWSKGQVTELTEDSFAAADANDD